MTTSASALRASMLSQADPVALAGVADECLADAPTPQVHHGPDVGTIMLTMREPVETTRFHLGEVLVTRCQVEHRGVTSWAMRMGSDRASALAAAVCQAEVTAAGPAAASVDRLVAETRRQLDAERADEWHELEPTIVAFEEMD
ncbi:MAG: phosphonate C-P lyase system protein PhnG [Actinomycetota bacterium]